MNRCVRCGDAVPPFSVCNCTEDVVIKEPLNEKLYDEYYDGYVYAPTKQYRMKHKMFMEFD